MERRRTPKYSHMQGGLLPRTFTSNAGVHPRSLQLGEQGRISQVCAQGVEGAAAGVARQAVGERAVQPEAAAARAVAEVVREGNESSVRVGLGQAVYMLHLLEVLVYSCTSINSVDRGACVRVRCGETEL